MIYWKNDKNKSDVPGLKMNFILSDEFYFKWWQGQECQYYDKFIDVCSLCSFNFTILLSTNTGEMQVDTSIYECKS